jgi:N-acyl-D-amino-acid deacylase
VLEWLRAVTRTRHPRLGQGLTTDAGFSFTFEDWNLFDDSEAWREATSALVERETAKLADPARRQALKDQMPASSPARMPGIVITARRPRRTVPWLDHTLALAEQRSSASTRWT